MNERLVHDMAMLMAEELVKIVRPCLRPEEVRDAVSEFYAVCRGGIETYEIQRARMLPRLNPTKN
jgi:hypothetical protein